MKNFHEINLIKKNLIDAYHDARRLHFISCSFKEFAKREIECSAHILTEKEKKELLRYFF